ncbi:MAG: tetratricopeptide repeat protein, partial [Nannocystaceae bacterium]|nr:tetratricopeptide repeat protein [Nannocystaceae bacterium]
MGKPAPTRPVPASPAPAPAAPPPPTAEVAASGTGQRPAEVDNDTFLRELGELEARLAKGAHAFDLLGVPLDAGKREIRRAFGDLSRKFHPDAMAARGLLDLRERVGNVFAALSEAQVLLNDETKREQLADAIQRGVSPTQAGADATAMARAAFESEMLAREGDKYLKAGRFDRAQEHYQRALALTKDEPDLRAAAAWCDYNLSSKARADAVRAEKILAEVVTEAPLIARAHYFRGLVLKDLGAVDPAIAALTKAAQLDPHLIDAERQARALRLAKPGAAAAAPAAARKGLFGGKKQ